MIFTSVPLLRFHIFDAAVFVFKMALLLKSVELFPSPAIWSFVMAERWWYGKSEETNWAEYNKALCKRGRGFQYSDTAIETALMIKGIFSLPLRALQGSIDSIFKLLDVPLTSPDYTCISKRSKTVQVRYRNKSRRVIRHIAIDSTGLKVFSEGEWKVKKQVKKSAEHGTNCT